MATTYFCLVFGGNCNPGETCPPPTSYSDTQKREKKH